MAPTPRDAKQHFIGRRQQRQTRQLASKSPEELAGILLAFHTPRQHSDE